MNDCHRLLHGPQNGSSFRYIPLTVCYTGRYHMQRCNRLLVAQLLYMGRQMIRSFLTFIPLLFDPGAYLHILFRESDKGQESEK